MKAGLLRTQFSYQNTVVREKMKEKTKESVSAVVPIMLIVLLLGFTIAPLSPSILVEFIVGAVLVIIGMVFFSLGAELSMTPMGERVGGSMLRTKKLWMIVAIGFILGVIITISEPDLQVLAGQVAAVPNMVLILSVAVGVGVFLVAALLRILFGIPLAPLLLVFYAIVFALAMFVPKGFLAVAFDSGGVTTGPMTVPFIMALGVGISSIRNDKHAGNDSFGLVSLCSIGPILAVLILGMVYSTEGNFTTTAITEVSDSVELGKLFLYEIPKYLKEIALSLLPIVVFFGVFQIFAPKMNKKSLMKICVGLVYTYIGLVLFLTGANVGFIPAGNYLGSVLASLSFRWIIVPTGMIIGYFIVKAEPAVYVLMHQVEELTSGIALILTLFVPKIFTAIAFDSGGVASGPMTATFLLPLAQGACLAVGGNIVTDAFGVVAMVAMTPLITLQILGVIYRIKDSRRTNVPQTVTPVVDMFAELSDDAIIEL